MLEWTFDALCTKCNFGIEQVEYINMIFGSNRQEAYMMPKCEQSVEKQGRLGKLMLHLKYFIRKWKIIRISWHFTVPIENPFSFNFIP
jgi:hypothetical protein